MNLKETTSHVKERVANAKEQVRDLGRTSGAKLDEARHWTADEVQSAASSVRTAGRHSSRSIDDLASATADKLDSTAAYVRRHDAGGMLADLREVMRRHPVGLFAAAAALGFLLVVANRAQRRD
jgi:hypothetical protein